MATSTSDEPVAAGPSIDSTGVAPAQVIGQQVPTISTQPTHTTASASARSSPRLPMSLGLGIHRSASQPSPHQPTSEARTAPSLAARRFESQRRKNSSDTSTLTPTLPFLAPTPTRTDPPATGSSQQTPLNASVPDTAQTDPTMQTYGNMQGQAAPLPDQQSLPQHEKQQQLMNFLTGYSVNQGVGMGIGSAGMSGSSSMMNSGGGVFPGMNTGNFNFAMRPMAPGGDIPMVPGTGSPTGLHGRTTGAERGPRREFYAGNMAGGPFDGMNIVDQNGMPVQMSAPQWVDPVPQAPATNQDARYSGQAGSSVMRHPFTDGMRATNASPVTTPLASNRANLPQGPPSSSSSRPLMESPVNQYSASPSTAPHNATNLAQSMDYGSIAMRLNQQNRATGSIAGMAPRPPGDQRIFQAGVMSQNPTPVAPNWGHIGLPEPSPANTPLLGATSNPNGPHAMDWTDSLGQSRRNSDMHGGTNSHEVKVERQGRQMRDTPNKSGTVTPVFTEHPGSYGDMSVPTSPEKHMNMPGGHHAGLISGVEHALADLHTGAGHGQTIGQAAARSRKKNTSASSSRVNSPDRKRKAAPVFSYSGALSALNSRAGSPTAENDGSKNESVQQSLSHVDMHAVGQALRADDSVNETPSSDLTNPIPPGNAPVPTAGTDTTLKGDYRKRKRNRTIQSCLPCHQNKRKCDRKKPCSRCKALGLTGSCVYEVDHDRDENDPDQSENDHLRDRIAELEQVVRELRQKGAMRTAVVTEVVDPALHKKRKFPGDTSTKLDTFVKEGKLSASSSRRTSVSDGQNHDPARRTSMRTWGSGSRRSSPEHGEEPYLAHTLLSPGEALIGDSLGRQAYVGVPGGRNMLRRLADLTASHANSRDLHDGHRGEPLESAAFTGFFPDQRKTFPFTTIWSHEHFSSEVVGILPSPVQARVLWMSFEEEIARYFSAWHLPSLKAEFEAFFELSNEDQMMTTLGTLSVMLMVCSLAVMVRASEKEIFGSLNDKSLSISDDEDDLTCSRMQSELYLSGAYQALRLCSFMSSPTISTITSEASQIMTGPHSQDLPDSVALQIMMVIYLLNSERASDAWPELGIVIRQAVAMGLHIDPLHLYPDLSFKDAEVRRRVWWTIAGLDALLCLSLGRPTAITYYTTQLPQDRPDEHINDQNDYATYPHPASETTTFTYHAAYFALTIPSLDILGRVFHQDRRYGRSVAKGWFAPPAAEEGAIDTSNSMGSFTYDDALRLDGDILAWYNLIPPGMRFDPDVDTAETLLQHRPQWQINQTLALCVKVQMIRLILHRPYLRVDPSAYTHSTEICFDASHAIMCAFKAMSGAKSSIAWSWWTMSLRAFHAGTVCAFLAIRQPDKSIAIQCLEDIRGAIMIFTGRLRTWLKAHPVQGHLCQGLVSLERLATTATKLSRQRQAAAASQQQGAAASGPGEADSSGTTFPSEMDTGSSVRPTSSGRYFNKSAIQAFPSLNSIPTSPGFTMESHAVPRAGSSLALNVTGRLPEEVDPTPFQHVFPVTQRSAVMENAAGARGSVDAMGLPQFWADVFGLPMDEDKSDPNPLLAL